MSDFSNRTIAELQALMEDLQQTLKTRQRAEQASVVAQIRKLAASIGAQVELRFDDVATVSGRRGGKVAPRYRNPADPAQTWTGRGIKPKWLQAYEAQGQSASHFLIQN